MPLFSVCFSSSRRRTSLQLLNNTGNQALSCALIFDFQEFNSFLIDLERSSKGLHTDGLSSLVLIKTECVRFVMAYGTLRNAPSASIPCGQLMLWAPSSKWYYGAPLWWNAWALWHLKHRQLMIPDFFHTRMMYVHCILTVLSHYRNLRANPTCRGIQKRCIDWKTRVISVPNASNRSPHLNNWPSTPSSTQTFASTSASSVRKPSSSYHMCSNIKEYILVSYLGR